MICALIANFSRPHAKELAHQVADYLQKKAVLVVAADGQAQELSLPAISGIDPGKIDLMLSFGGDGSILNLIHTYPHIEAPIMGINIGTLGFLADIPPATIFQSLDKVLAGNYTIQERHMLCGVKDNSPSSLAVNDIVVHRGPNHSLVDIGLTVDGIYLNSFSADGLIVSTPSGSTAYSLSAGGPIVDPELEAVVITPICPHALSNRPIVLRFPQEIEIQYISDDLPVEIAFDGICRFSLKPKEKFLIKPAPRRFRLVSIPGFDYFATLRNKLSWTGTLRSY